MKTTSATPDRLELLLAEWHELCVKRGVDPESEPALRELSPERSAELLRAAIARLS